MAEHNEAEVLALARGYALQFRLENEPVSATFQCSPSQNDGHWVVKGLFELFGEEREFFYWICDNTGRLLHTMCEHQSDPHFNARPPPGRSRRARRSSYRK